MKIFYIFLIFLLNICIVNAEINTFKEQYSQKETFQAELNFQNLVEELNSENIIIYDSNNQPTDIGVLFAKITNDKYFVYFEVPEVEDGSYFLKAEVKYLDNNVLKREIFIKDFLIKNEQNNLMSISPPYLVFKSEEKNFFRINIKNTGDNILNIKILDDSNLTNIFNNNFSLAKNSENFFYLSINEDNIKDRDNLNIKITYNEKLFLLPIYLLKDNEEIQFFTRSQEEKNYLDSYELEIPFGNYAESILFIENNLNRNLSNLTILITDNIKDIIKLGFYKVELLNSKDSLGLDFFINQDRKAEGNYKGNLVVKNSEIESILPISINIIQSQLYNITEKTVEKIQVNKTEIQNQTIKKEKNIDNKTLSYLLIVFVLLLFFLIYLILYIKTGRKRRFRR